MFQSLCQTILFKWMGWKMNVTVPVRDKCILCVAPHTSNWDFIIGELFCTSQGRTAGFLMKKEWFFWPLGRIFKKMGGIPVKRQKNCSLTDILAEEAKQADYFNLAVTPEGTRQKTTTWKRGFYYIALKANLPIQLYGIDAQSKTIVCTKEIIPSGDVEKDLREIMEYYRPFKGRGIKPQLFEVEEI